MLWFIQANNVPDTSNLVTIASLIVTGCLGPVALAWMKSRSNNLTYAWDNARETQRQLIEAKNHQIRGLMDDIDELQAKLAEQNLTVFEAERQRITAEQEKLALIRRLIQYEEVTGHDRRPRTRLDNPPNDDDQTRR